MAPSLEETKKFGKGGVEIPTVPLPEYWFKVAHLKRADFAHVVIDVQKRFFDHSHPLDQRYNREVASKIERANAGFRQKGIKNYLVYYHHANEKNEAGFFNITPVKGDEIVPKNDYSAISSGPLLQMLRRDGKKALVISGMHYCNCVEATVVDALKTEIDAVRKAGFIVYLLTDLVADHSYDPEKIKKSTDKMVSGGAILTNYNDFMSGVVLKLS